MRILIATRNEHKVQEISSIIGDAVEVWSLSKFPEAPAVVEDAPDFAGNAAKKAITLARYLARRDSGPSIGFVLADDSGLEVDALGGAPGVHSARFAALDSGAPGNSSDADNNVKLLRLLAGVPPAQRTARFQCVLALTPVSGTTPAGASPTCALTEAEIATQLFSGTCEGRILERPSGGGGFGYDPLFVPNGFAQSFAQLGDSIKNRISHRAKALEQLREALTTLRSLRI